jgi:hypothetical protein
MPYLFAGSAATAAGGFGMLAVPTDYAGQAIRLAVLGAATELTAKSMLLQRLGDKGEPYRIGRAGKLMEVGEGWPRLRGPQCPNPWPSFWPSSSADTGHKGGRPSMTVSAACAGASRRASSRLAWVAARSWGGRGGRLKITNRW